jgi:hypothetical protein
MEFATRNIAVATAIALTLAGRVELAVFATAYLREGWIAVQRAEVCCAH